MLPLWQNRFFNLRFFFLILFLPSWAPVGAKEEALPGLTHSLEQILKIKSKEYQELVSQVGKNPKIKGQLTSGKSWDLNPNFLSHLLLYSDPKYIGLSKNGECYFYSLLENNLLKIGLDSPENLVVDFSDEKGVVETVLLPKQDYLQLIYQSKCINNKEIQSLFTLANFHNLIQKIELRVPKDEKECKSILGQWTQNPYTPYICRISEIFQTAKRYSQELPQLSPAKFQEKRKYQDFLNFAQGLKTKLDTFRFHYINNLCQNLWTPELFCQNYLSDSFWNKVLQGERAASFMKFRCEAILKRKILTKQDFEKCAQEMEARPEVCQYVNSQNFPSLVPKPDCQSISKALNHTNLRAPYQDCPSRINNEGIVTTYRVLTHLSNKAVDNTPQNCHTAPASNFAKLVLEFGQENMWNFKICHYDKLEDRDSCSPIILGEYEESEMSENRVLTEILTKTQANPDNFKCLLVDSRDYRPHLLQYRRGCFMVYDPQNCTSMECPKTIYYNERKLGQIKYLSGTSFSYFPTNIREEQYSIASLYKSILKMKTIAVKNLTDLKFFLSQDKNSIIHGMGCIEDLYPSYFKKISMNQCRPVPFLIDGYFKEDRADFLVIRTGPDDVQSPRILAWNYIFTAVKNYQEIHPLKTWNLYVIK